jgi:hypothetical protein
VAFFTTKQGPQAVRDHSATTKAKAQVPDYIPRRDVDAVEFVQRVSTQLSADPTSLACDAQTAMRYAQLVSEFATAYADTQSNIRRTPTALVRKNALRQEVVAMTRQIIAWARSSATDEALLAIDLRKRRRAHRRIAPPAGRPTVQLEPIGESRLKVSVRPTPATPRGGLPKGAIMVQIWWQVGETPTDRWNGPQGTGRRNVVLELSSQAAPVGSRVWVKANYINARTESGPSSYPVSVRMAFGEVAPLSAA